MAALTAPPDIPLAVRGLLSALLKEPYPSELGFTSLGEERFSRAEDIGIGFAALGVGIEMAGDTASILQKLFKSRGKGRDYDLLITTLLLLFCPDTHSAWNCRKSHLSTQEELEGELWLCDLIATNSGKASSMWYHRLWCIRSMEGNERYEMIDYSLGATERAVKRWPKNYYAWTHRMHLLGMLDMRGERGSRETKWCTDWLRGNPSDHCAVAHLWRIVQPGHEQEAMSEVLSICKSYPTHVTPWRAVRAVGLKMLRRGHGIDEILTVWKEEMGTSVINELLLCGHEAAREQAHGNADQVQAQLGALAWILHAGQEQQDLKDRCLRKLSEVRQVNKLYHMLQTDIASKET